MCGHTTGRLKSRPARMLSIAAGSTWTGVPNCPALEEFHHAGLLNVPPARVRRHGDVPIFGTTVCPHPEQSAHGAVPDGSLHVNVRLGHRHGGLSDLPQVEALEVGELPRCSEVAGQLADGLTHEVHRTLGHVTVPERSCSPPLSCRRSHPRCGRLGYTSSEGAVAWRSAKSATAAQATAGFRHGPDLSFWPCGQSTLLGQYTARTTATKRQPARAVVRRTKRSPLPWLPVRAINCGIPSAP